MQQTASGPSPDEVMVYFFTEEPKYYQRDYSVIMEDLMKREKCDWVLFNEDSRQYANEENIQFLSDLKAIRLIEISQMLKLNKQLQEKIDEYDKLKIKPEDQESLIQHYGSLRDTTSYQAISIQQKEKKASDLEQELNQQKDLVKKYQKEKEQYEQDLKNKINQYNELLTKATNELLQKKKLANDNEILRVQSQELDQRSAKTDILQKDIRNLENQYNQLTDQIRDKQNQLNQLEKVVEERQKEKEKEFQQLKIEQSEQIISRSNEFVIAQNTVKQNNKLHESSSSKTDSPEESEINQVPYQLNQFQDKSVQMGLYDDQGI
ncbi:unnamed protein product (macronuclear) [Paramecium tetraurelia]|uniref:Uncharacterized protein n=1 Tax=Paramecium tetraurelia TaxID=5888 RepID=A0CF99_PARTE|nr:uncharacterized protein GSPATT00037905001 [Paramecium tetraurelia]CAK69466.1 unnamed protein product [Paramecium tetraurelia]|eukprot:XP_001436863.1 hypothetical protein (macronuclear) [Paramecium tetraurelia strain d4-2]